MNSHLSQKQFARCFVGVCTNEEREHLADCAECRAELDSFGNTVSSLRHAIRGRVDAQMEARPSAVVPVSIPATIPGMRKVRWVVATAAVLLFGMIPFLTSEKPQAVTVTSNMPVETSPDALMNAINVHLSRTIPAPMEPMMSLIPSDESSTE
jgi:anti-sigma factor RsiW